MREEIAFIDFRKEYGLELCDVSPYGTT